MTGIPAKSLGKPPRDRIVQNGRILSGIEQEVPALLQQWVSTSI